jgi:kynurenine formamidase
MNLAGAKLLDLSLTLGPNPSEVVPVGLQPMDHRFGGRHLAELVGMAQDDLPEGLGWASERLEAITHAGTHMDSPFHYSPRCGDRPSRTIDELPVEWFWGPGVCIPVDQEETGTRIRVEELERFEERTGTTVGPGHIVLFRTGAEAWHGDESYNHRGRGLEPSLVRELVARGVRVLGTDAWSIDPPFDVMRDQLAIFGPGSVWSAHYVGREMEFCAMERLCNLDSLPPVGFWLSCFPIKVYRGSAGWVRVVAFLDGSERRIS